MFEAVVRVDTFNGCCERLSVVNSGRDGRDVGVVTKVVEAEDPTGGRFSDDGGGIVGIGMCFNINFFFSSRVFRWSYADDSRSQHATAKIRTFPFHYDSSMDIFRRQAFRTATFAKIFFFLLPRTVSMAIAQPDTRNCYFVQLHTTRHKSNGDDAPERISAVTIIIKFL